MANIQKKKLKYTVKIFITRNQGEKMYKQRKTIRKLLGSEIFKYWLGNGTDLRTGTFDEIFVDVPQGVVNRIKERKPRYKGLITVKITKQK